jgi:curved DNA-binding protein
MPGPEFTDYYELLQISPNAEPETIQRVFKMLAARYHPDNPNTGDLAKFLLLNDALKVLSDPDARRQYDALHETRGVEPIDLFELKEFTLGVEGENNRRMGILCILYNRRRSNPDYPGLSILHFETLMSFPREHLMFTLWYLRDQGYIRLDERSDYEITSSGVDYVEAKLPSNKLLYRLLKEGESAPRASDGSAAADGSQGSDRSAGPDRFAGPDRLAGKDGAVS